MASREQDLYLSERTTLYTNEELMVGYSSMAPRQSLDARIRDHVKRSGGRSPGLAEGLAQTKHDLGIARALDRLLRGEADGRERRVVGMLGWHRVPRTEGAYRLAVETAWELARAGYLVATGGGLGIMEAANLGAYLAPHERGAIDEALEMLAAPPTYSGNEAERIASAVAVRERFATGPAGAGEALAVASWMYEDETISQFADPIAKYFQNSIREDSLLAVADRGVVFLRGGFGTLQEIFQAAEQNEKPQYGAPRSMVFLDEQYAESNPASAVHVLRAAAPPWAHMVHVAKDTADALAFIRAHDHE